MCGIAGAVNLRRDAPRRDLSEIVIRMRDTMLHRGPDAAGFWSEEGTVFLAHRRLSIVDLSDHGRQPMSYAAGRYTITFNGEIYNFRELAEELTQLGHHLSSTGDTQVLLAAIAQWGLEGALRRAVGMFAFGLWDAETGVLHLARDRMGEKPLHVCELDGILYFASEVRAFRALDGFDSTLSREGVAGYLQFGYVPEPLSIFEGVLKLPPGTTLSVPARKDRVLANWAAPRRDRDEGPSGVVPVEYWSCTKAARDRYLEPISADAEAKLVFEEVLRQSIKNQMVCDVPTGCFLSGGLDSSLVAAVMQSESSSPVHTFTVRFDTPGFDESEHARRIAAHLGTRHQEFLLSEKDVFGSVPSIVNELDEPTANGSFFAVRQISKLARSRATVVLSGDGGDELFAGYNRYRLALRAWAVVSRLPASARVPIGHILSRMKDARAGGAIMRAVSMARQSTAKQAIEKLTRTMRAEEFAECYDYVTSCWPRYSLNPPDGLRHRAWSKLPALSAMLLSDQVDYLPGDSLAKVDRASMAVNLETRLPLLDHRLVELSWRIPEGMKLRNNRSKWLMRDLLDRLVPKELTDRPKMGFSVPIDSWIRGPLAEWSRDHFRSRALVEATNEILPRIPDLVASMESDSVTAYQKWSLAVLGAWLDNLNAKKAFSAN